MTYVWISSWLAVFAVTLVVRLWQNRLAFWLAKRLVGCYSAWLSARQCNDLAVKWVIRQGKFSAYSVLCFIWAGLGVMYGLISRLAFGEVTGLDWVGLGITLACLAGTVLLVLSDTSSWMRIFFHGKRNRIEELADAVQRSGRYWGTKWGSAGQDTWISLPASRESTGEQE